MIEVRSLSKHFGGIKAVDRVSMRVREGSITGLIGPNGAGKTTLFNIIAGQYPPTHGAIYLSGEDITAMPSHQLFHKGLLRTFQIAHEFSTMSVTENLMMVPGGQTGERLLNSWFRRRAIAVEEQKLHERAMEVLDFLDIASLAQEQAGNLSGGQKKLLELGRTMMVDPKVVLLDEAGAGVNKTMLTRIGKAIVRLNKERKYTFVLIEHDMDFIARLCDVVLVMADGALLTQGSVDEIRANEQVIEAYLGKKKPA